MHKLTLWVMVAKFLQPFASVPVTVYVVFTVGEIPIVVFVDEVFHEYVLAPFAARAPKAPAQMVGLLAIVIVGFETMVIVICADAAHAPEPLVTVYI